MDLINRADKLLQLVEIREQLKEKYPNIFIGYASDLSETINNQELTKYFKGHFND